MAVAWIQEFTIGDRSTVNYDFMAKKLGEGPFEGLIAHAAGFDDEAGVFRVFDIWETRAQAERFFEEHLEPLMALGPEAFPNPATAVEPPFRQGFYELHDLLVPQG
jgi:hypothetical protein